MLYPEIQIGIEILINEASPAAERTDAIRLRVHHDTTHARLSRVRSASHGELLVRGRRARKANRCRARAVRPTLVQPLLDAFRQTR